MAFYIEHRPRTPRGPGKAMTKRATTWECVAEEFLNGLLCHYEPPQHPYELIDIDDDAETPESDYRDQLMLRRPPSILKTSRSFEGNKHKKANKKGVRFHGVPGKQSNNNKQGGLTQDRKHHGHHHRPRFLKKLACRKVNLNI